MYLSAQYDNQFDNNKTKMYFLLPFPIPHNDTYSRKVIRRVESG